MPHRALGTLIECTYDAALDPSVWRIFLERLIDATGDHVAAIDIHDLRSRYCHISFQVGLAEDRLRSYAEYYSSLNPWLNQAPEALTTGRVAVGEELIADKDLVRTEFYCDWLEQLNLRRNCGVIVSHTAEVVAALSVVRDNNRPPFTREEVALFQELRPHLQRAVEINRRLETADEIGAASRETLDCFPTGVLLLDGLGRTLIANREALQILDARDGLSQGREGLSGATSTGTQALRRLIVAAALCASGRARVGGSLTLERPSMRRALELLVVPIGKRRWMTSGPEVAVFVRDPERRVDAAPDMLRRLYGLTAAEARLAASLMEGATLEHVAGRFAISEQTVRSQLKQVFLKTRTNRQSELVRLLLSSPASLTSGPQGNPTTS